MRPAFFFDRDGIVNRRVVGGYVTRVQEFVFLPAIFPLFAFVKRLGWFTVLVTNQQGIGKGLMTENDLADIHAAMQTEFQMRTGSKFDAIVFAGELDTTTSAPAALSIRRKPSPAMLLEAAEAWELDLANSWILGDSHTDAEAGRAAGVRTVLVGEEFQAADADIVLPTLIQFHEYMKQHESVFMPRPGSSLHTTSLSA
jgi:D-glycero-D-manno-heptose 1,7-bisphosphate phosphatase